MKFRAYLVDDEPLALKRLARLLDETGRFEIAGAETDPVSAAGFLKANAVDVLFLDIQMPGMTGFELLAQIPEQQSVIFTTAYDQYALKAFEVNSVDYLLKPVDPKHLERAVKKLDRMRSASGPKLDLRALAAELAASMQAPKPEPLRRIASRVGERVHFIDLPKITHFFAEDKLTYAAAGGRNHSVDWTIAELETKLDGAGFVRIHRSVLVNLAWVQEVDAWFAGRVAVRLRDEKKTELVVARDRVKVLRERLGY